MAARNAEDGISAAQTAESALLEIASLAQRMRELGIQADNYGLQSTASDKAALDAESGAIGTAIDAIVQKATFNGVQLLNTSDVTKNIGVTDDGGTLTLTFKAVASAVAAVASGADSTADAVLEDVAIAMGHVAAGINNS